MKCADGVIEAAFTGKAVYTHVSHASRSRNETKSDVCRISIDDETRNCGGQLSVEFRKSVRGQPESSSRWT